MYKICEKTTAESLFDDFFVIFYESRALQIKVF